MWEYSHDSLLHFPTDLLSLGIDLSTSGVGLSKSFGVHAQDHIASGQRQQQNLDPVYAEPTHVNPYSDILNVSRSSSSSSSTNSSTQSARALAAPELLNDSGLSNALGLSLHHLPTQEPFGSSSSSLNNPNATSAAASSSSSSSLYNNRGYVAKPVHLIGRSGLSGYSGASSHSSSNMMAFRPSSFAQSIANANHNTHSNLLNTNNNNAHNVFGFVPPPTLAAQQSAAAAEHYQVETLHLLMNAFRSKVQTELEESFVALERRSREIREDVLTMLEGSVDEVEDRLNGRIEVVEQRKDLAEAEAKRVLQTELATMRGELRRALTLQKAKIDEITQRVVTMDQSVLDIQAKQVGDVGLDGSGSGGVGGAGGSAAQQLRDQRLDEMQQQLSLAQSVATDLQHLRVHVEKRLLETHTQLLEVHEIFAGVVAGEERSNQSRSAQVKAMFAAMKQDYEAYVEGCVADLHKLHASLREHVESVERTQTIALEQLKRVCQL